MKVKGVPSRHQTCKKLCKDLINKHFFFRNNGLHSYRLWKNSVDLHFNIQNFITRFQSPRIKRLAI